MEYSLCACGAGGGWPFDFCSNTFGWFGLLFGNNTTPNRPILIGFYSLVNQNRPISGRTDPSTLILVNFASFACFNLPPHVKKESVSFQFYGQNRLILCDMFPNP